MNILITCIGALPENAPVVQYNKGTVSARMTGEACCKYLLKKRGHAPDLIISLCTPDALKENKQKHFLSGWLCFTDAVRSFCETENLDTPVFENVRISKGEESANYFGKSIYRVQKLIQENSIPDDTLIMIDTSLKAHPINIMLQMMTRLLRNDGYQLIESYYAYPEKESITEDHTNHQLEMIEAITAFSEHGSAEKMIACFSKNSRKKPEPIVQRMLDAMQDFSDSIQLCQTERLQEILSEEIFPMLLEIENMTGPAALREDVFTLKLMADEIRKQFGYSQDGETGAITPMCLIEWCIRNRYIQQAVTMFTESIPKYLLHAGILQYDGEFLQQFNTPEVNLLYTQIIYACCPGEVILPLDPIAAERRESRSNRLALMRRFLDTGYVNAKDVPLIRVFIHTMSHFKQLIGSQRPQAALAKYTPANVAEKLLMDAIDKFNPTNYTKFVNTLKVQPNALTAFLHLEEAEDPLFAPASAEQSEEPVTEMDEIDKKLSGIRHFSIRTVRENLPGIRLNISRDHVFEFRRFLAYFVFIKKCVRNYLNHAREYTGELTPEQAAEFRTYSVQTGSLTIRSISENLTDALACLDACIIRPSDVPRPVKKYYVPIQKRPQIAVHTDPVTKLPRQSDGVTLKRFLNPMNVPIFDYGETRFSVIPVLANTANPGEVVKVYGLKPRNSNADYWEMSLREELNSLSIEKDFDIEYESVVLPSSDNFAAPMELLHTLAGTVAEGDRIYLDMTFVENPLPMVMMMLIEHLRNFRNDFALEAAFYGQFDNEQMSYALYDLTGFFCAGQMMCDPSTGSSAEDLFASVLSFGAADETPAEAEAETESAEDAADAPDSGAETESEEDAADAPDSDAETESEEDTADAPEPEAETESEEDAADAPDSDAETESEEDTADAPEPEAETESEEAD